ATEVIEAPLAAGGVVPRASDRPDLPPALTAAPNVFTLLQALRRRWLLALSLATFFAVLAAGVTWPFVAPAQYQASAFIRITSQPPRILWELREAKTDWATYQRNQVELIRKTRFVLITALRQPKVASLPTVQEHDHPVDWLTKELEVEVLPNSELMRVALRGD